MSDIIEYIDMNSDAIIETLDRYDSLIETITSIFEIRLNPSKTQELFNDNKCIDLCRKIIQILNSIDYNIYTIVLPDKIVYIYYKDNMFFQFDKGHYNLKIKDMFHYCMIRDIDYNNITLDCRSNTCHDTIIQQTHSIMNFDNIIEDINSYRIHMLDIFI